MPHTPFKCLKSTYAAGLASLINKFKVAKNWYALTYSVKYATYIVIMIGHTVTFMPKCTVCVCFGRENYKCKLAVEWAILDLEFMPVIEICISPAC